MLKLYKRDIKNTHYWETWDKTNKIGIIHWGIVGQKGETSEISSSLFSSHHSKIQTVINQKIKEGYKQIDVEDHYTLLIEYLVDGMGTIKEVEKRNKLQDKMDQVLGWSGLGHCDGGSIGSGTMEVCCLVVDFDIAKVTIEKSLLDTEFSDYTRIYNENEE